MPGRLTCQNGDHLRLLFAPVCLFLATGGWAQEPPPSNPPQRPPISPQETPDTSEQQSSEYEGPAILSRGGAATVVKGTELLLLRPYVAVSGVYDSGLGTVSVDQQGHAVVADSFGEEVRLGVTGRHNWKKTEIDLDYRGSLRHYSRSSYYDGMDNSLMLTLRHEASRRVRLELEETAGRYEYSSFMPYNLGSYYNPMTSGLTSTEMFNTPTEVLMSSARMTYQRTSRLSFGMGGTGFVVRRRSQALIGAEGYVVTGDVAYRLSRYQTIGLDYTFGHFNFTHQFGSSDFHGVAFDYAARIGKHWEFGLRAGGFRVEASRLTEASVDPAIAAILGQTTVIEVFHRVLYAPHYEGHLTRGSRHGSWSLSYVRTIMPGNGVYLTSGYDTAQTIYSYSGLSKVALQCRFGYYGLSSVSQTIGRYRGVTGGGGATVRLTRGMSLAAQIDGRRYDANGTALRRTAYRASLGLVWSPGERPLAIW